MTDASTVLLISITFTILDASYARSPTIRSAKLTAKRIDPSTAAVSWDSENGDFLNATVQFRRSTSSDWIDSRNGTSMENSRFSHRLSALDACSNYKIRLISDDRYYSETIELVRESIPEKIDSLAPVIEENSYDHIDGSIDVIFSIENHTLASWPLSSRELTTNVHVVECGRSQESGAVVPSVRWISNSKGAVKFDSYYVNSAINEDSCRVMISVIEPCKICDRSLKLDGELLDNALFVDLSCSTTKNLPCPVRKKAPAPRCDPDFVDASQIVSDFVDGGSKSLALRVRWDFDRNTTAEFSTPNKVMLRYGYADVPSNASTLFAAFVPMRELDRFEVDGLAKSATFRTNKSAPEIDHDRIAIGRRFYRISVCAVYGNDNESEQRINWAIIPTFSVKMNQIREENTQPACRCDDSDPTTPRSLKVTESVSLAPAIVSLPSAHECENFWTKVTPLLVVFISMTMINLVLLMASYYYYRNTRSLKSMK